MSGLIIDGILLIIIIGCIINGSKKGFVRTIVYLAGYIIAVGAASMISSSGSNYIYDSFIKPKIMTAIETKIDKAEYNIKEKFSETLKSKGINISSSDVDLIISGRLPNINQNSVLTKEKINDTLSNVLSEYYGLLAGSLSDALPNKINEEIGKNVNDDIGNSENIVTAFSKSKQETAKYVEQRIIRPVIIRCVRYMLFALVFALAMFIVGIVLRMTWIVKKLPVIGKADKFLGGFLGFLQGMVIVLIISALAVIIVKLSNDSFKYLNSDVVSHTILFSYVYGIILKILV